MTRDERMFEDVLLGLTEEEAEYASCLDYETFWQWYARKVGQKSYGEDTVGTVEGHTE